MRLRWWLWGHACRLPGVCPVGAHSRIITGGDMDWRVNGSCRRDCEANGSCWCGKLRTTPLSFSERNAHCPVVDK